MEKQNLIETALASAKAPFVAELQDGSPIIFTPGENGAWSWQVKENHRTEPARKRGTTLMNDTASMIKFVNKHKQAGTEIYIGADFQRGQICVKAILNGHTEDATGFCDHRAQFEPVHTPAANKWLQANSEKLNQMQFAHFLTNQARDIVSQNPDNEAAKYPTAAEVLDFALNLEYTEKTTFKQGFREQDGRINFTFQSEDAGKTETQLKAFERFAIAFTPFQGGDSYFVEALLKFRIDKNSGALVLWYELQQIEAVIERACADIAATLQTAFADVPIYYGQP